MIANRMKNNIKQILKISRFQLLIAIRQMSFIKILGFSFYLLLVLSLGISFALIFLGVFTQDSNFQPPMAYRDMLTFVFLAFFGTPLSYMILSGITGFRNPYIKDRQDAHFFQRVQIEPSVMYFSTRFIGFLKVMFFVSSITIFLFEPLMIVLKIPWWRIFFVMVIIIFTFVLSGKIADLVFVIFSKTRSKRRWMKIWIDGNFAIQGTVLLSIPGIALLLLNLFIIPTFESLSKYFFLPYVNAAVAASGFFFRSGIPKESWFGLLFLVVETIGLLLITNFVMSRYKPNNDINELITILAFQVTSIYDLGAVKNLETSDLVSEDLKGKTNFRNKSPLKAYLLKDWLAIRRIRKLRRHLFQAPIIIVLLSVLFIFLLPEGNQFFYSLLVIGLYPIAEFSLQITKLEYRKPMKNFVIKRRNSILSKTFFIIIGSLAYSIPLFIAKGVIVIPIITFVACVGAIIGSTRFSYSMMSNLFIILVVLLMIPIFMFI